jgi:hypothetical protein
MRKMQALTGCFGKAASKVKLKRPGCLIVSLLLCEFFSLGLVLQDCSIWLDNSLYQFAPFLKPVLNLHLKRKLVDCNAAWAWPQGETLGQEAAKAEIAERTLKEPSFGEKARRQLALAVPTQPVDKSSVSTRGGHLASAALHNQECLKKELTKGVHKPGVITAARQRQITITMPATVEEGLAFFEREMAQLEVIARKGLRQAGQMTHAFSSSLGSNGLITPVSRPYVGRSPAAVASGHRIFYTREGRLKSFVNR